MELITNILLDRVERKNVYRGVPLPPDRGKKSSPGFSRAWNAGKGIHGSLFLRRDGWTGEGINPSREISLNVIGSRPIGVVARKLSPPRQKLNGGQKSRLSSVHPLVIFSSIHRAGRIFNRSRIFPFLTFSLPLSIIDSEGERRFPGDQASWTGKERGEFCLLGGDSISVR